MSTLPTVYGEKCVTRLLKKDQSLADITRLGIPPVILDKLIKTVKLPQGLALVTGPDRDGSVDDRAGSTTGAWRCS